MIKTKPAKPQHDAESKSSDDREDAKDDFMLAMQTLNYLACFVDNAIQGGRQTERRPQRHVRSDSLHVPEGRRLVRTQCRRVRS